MDNEILESQEIERNKTNDKPWLFKKGNPGGPGRPKGKSLKEYSRDYLASLTDEERQDFLEGIPKTEIWKMAEGLPQQDITSDGKQLPTPIYIPGNLGSEEDKPVEQEN